MNEYFSDREQGPRAREKNEIDERLWQAIVSIIDSRISDGSFGKEFPERCRDDNHSQAIIGTNVRIFEDRLYGVIGFSWSDRYRHVPYTFQILDLVEYCYKYIAEPQEIKTPYKSIQNHYDYYGHKHLEFNVESGQKKFIDEINTLFAHNNIAYELKSHGEIQRLLPPELEEAVISTRFNTGDGELNELLENAREKLLDKEPQTRKESLEKLWDAWERLKTLEPGNKKTSAKLLLDKVTSEPHLRERIEKEAIELTEIGNKFRIRHSETDKIPIDRDEDVEYLFYRMFSLILLILKTTGRCR